MSLAAMYPCRKYRPLCPTKRSRATRLLRIRSGNSIPRTSPKSVLKSTVLYLNTTHTDPRIFGIPAAVYRRKSTSRRVRANVSKYCLLSFGRFTDASHIGRRTYHEQMIMTMKWMHYSRRPCQQRTAATAVAATAAAATATTAWGRCLLLPRM